MKNVFTILLIISFAASFSFAQEEKALREKLKDIKGEIQKITIETDEGDVTFEGEEAEKLAKRLKQPRVFMRDFDANFDFDIPKINVDSMLASLPKMDSLKIFIKKHLNDSAFASLKKMKMFKFDDSSSSHFKRFKFNMDDSFNDFDLYIDIDGDKDYKKMIIDDDEGEKRVTVTSRTDGEKSTKVYKGKEAEEYLESIKDEIDFDSESLEQKIIIRKKK